jgi:hypothetical protein
MSLPENHCSTLFTTGYKRLTEGGWRAFALGFLLWAFCLRLLLFGFWAFGFLMWEALEGKRIAEGEKIAVGKRIAEGKMNC